MRPLPSRVPGASMAADMTGFFAVFGGFVFHAIRPDAG